MTVKTVVLGNSSRMRVTAAGWSVAAMEYNRKPRKRNKNKHRMK